MNVSTNLGQAESASPPRVSSDATVKAAAQWISLFARTLKTCRLYDRANPTVVKFREELMQAASQLLDEHGTITFRFVSDDVLIEDVSLHKARSRDDNLAYPFHRDGVRAVTLQPGLDARELDALVDAVLAVTGQNLDDDDLVTLLWEANLRHLDIDYIPAEGDVGSGAPVTTDDGSGPLLPWPTPDAAEPEKAADSEGAEAADGGSGRGRSEDWQMGDLTVEVEASYVELDALAPTEVERFRREFTQEHLVPPATASLAIALACLRAEASEEDRQEMGHFLPRVLRGALATGAWSEAGEALRTLRPLASPEWSEETFLQELMQPISITRLVEKLDQQEPDRVAEYLALAREIGDHGIDWMTLALSESQQRHNRQILAEALAQICRSNPERLAPWLSDGRWYVVRNIVHILGWIGGPGIVGLLKVALRHGDRRVHEQVVASLARVDLKEARPLLIHALDGADTALFCQILGQLSAARDPATARFVFAFMEQLKFDLRPAEERRAIYAAVASVGGDELVPELEAELFQANWFDLAKETHRHNIARCLARIGTARAREALAHATQSKRGPVRLAALAAMEPS